MSALGQTIVLAMADKQTVRLTMCGNDLTIIDPRIGQRRPFEFRCGIFRDCEQCLTRRAVTEKQQIFRGHHYDDGNPLLLAELSFPDARKLVKELNDAGASYRRYPTDNGIVYIVHNLAGASAGVMMGVDDMPWLKMVKTPNQSRLSGNLGKKKPKKTHSSDEPFVVATYEGIKSTATPDIEDLAWDKAVELTSWYSQIDLGNLVEVLESRTTAFKSQIEQLGYEITFMVSLSRRVYGSTIDWNAPDDIDLEMGHLGDMEQSLESLIAKINSV